MMALPCTGLRENYSSPDILNPPSAFESTTYTLDVSVLHCCFCLFHSHFTLASSMPHPYVLLFSSSGFEGSCKKQSQVSCQTFAVRLSANMISTAIFLSMSAITDLLLGEVVPIMFHSITEKHCCIQHLDCVLIDSKECVLFLLLQNSFPPFMCICPECRRACMRSCRNCLSFSSELYQPKPQHSIKTYTSK